ncbi:PAS domain S-box protein [Chamaesiphon sp. GL140_3_metabinner_50]|uniref:PAS domain S-box protein n=1 Tax=Chamaesiphon sp. GL140_3_metabinner_50 TaxID=2970812 RepID=UPI0025D2C870|nr:PAS domain S-box protein [Chamaesiphon sp. GL140_3_metabinner_50]
MGLKYDLELCQELWQTTGTVAEFKLGARDLSDRFTIPERLYGREFEVKTLLNACDRVANGNNELVLVAGSSGIGKTALINELHKPITRQHGYFIAGKFDQFNRNIPLSGFVRAFRDLIRQLTSESDSQLADWRDLILTAVGEHGRVLIEVIPELERIIGTQPPTIELAGIAAQQRFNWVFQKFVEVFTTAAHPLTIFLDDLQWADSASLESIELLMSGKGYLLILGAYRDNEVSPAHPLMLTIERLQQARKIVCTIALTSLNFDDTNSLVADTLHCSIASAQPLTELIDLKTQGNPFFATQFLKALHQDGEIWFNPEGYWECEIASIQALALSDDIVEFMAAQLQKLPPQTQHLLELAACIGDKFDLETLAIVSQQSPLSVATALWNALQAGSILPTNQIYKFWQSETPRWLSGAETTPPLLTPYSLLLTPYSSLPSTYRFLHDRVQQAAYSLIPEHQQQQTHLQIGRLLLTNTPAAQRGERLFEIVNHLNLAICAIELSEVSGSAGLAERELLVRLNLDAARKARAANAYAAAFDYAQIGVDLVGELGWTHQYQLTLAVHETLAEAAFLNGDFEAVPLLAKVVLERAKTPLDRVKTYETIVQCHTLQKQYQESIARGLEILQQLGFNFSSKPNKLTLGKAIVTTQAALWGRSPESLVNLPNIIAPEKTAPLKILNLLMMPAFLCSQELMVVFITAGIQFTLRHGNSPWSSIFYSTYGIVLASLGNFNQSYQMGKLAAVLNDKFDEQSVTAQVNGSVAWFCQPWREHLRNSSPLMAACIKGCFDSGNLTALGLSYCVDIIIDFNLGIPLDKIVAKIAIAQSVVDRSPDFSQQLLSISHHIIRNLREIATPPTILANSIEDEVALIDRLKQTKEASALSTIYAGKTFLAYTFEDIPNALVYADAQLPYEHADSNCYSITTLWMFDALTRLAAYPHSNKRVQTQLINRIKCTQRKLLKCARLTPVNFQHKYDLVEAERCRVAGNFTKAIELYDRAISGAKTNEFLSEEALALELAAKFYLGWGKPKIAATYMQDAYYCYAKWGATAKINDLERRYPQLLAPILQLSLQPTTTNFLSTLSKITIGSQASLPSSKPDTFDLVSAIQTAQTLASIIELPELLERSSQVLLEHSGAQICIHILRQRRHATEEDWQVCQVSRSPDRGTRKLVRTTLATCDYLPQKLIHSVINRPQTTILDWETIDPDFLADEYLSRHRPQSAMCLPLIDRGELQGLIYLEHRDTAGIFVPNAPLNRPSQQQIILEFLASQAAISLTNVQLYESVVQRSAAIEASLDGFAILDNDRFIYLNQSHADLFGYTISELLDRDWHCLYTPDQIQAFETTVFPAVSQFGQWRGEAIATRKDGTTFNEEVTLFSLDNGQLICICRDITDRKGMEFALRQSEQRYHQLVSNVPGALYQFEITAAGHPQLNYVSARFPELFGVSAESALADISILVELVVPADRSIEARSLEKATRLGREWSWEGRIVTPSGELKWIRGESRPFVTPDGRFVWDGILRDVTTRKQTEIALRQSEERYQKLSDNIPGVIYQFRIAPDGSLSYPYLSSGCGELFQLSAAAGMADAQRLIDLVHPEDRHSFEMSMVESARKMTPRYWKGRLMLQSGETKWIECKSRPERQPDGAIVWDGVLMDITAQKAAEDELYKSQQQIKAFIDNSPAAMYLKNLEGCLQLCNQTFVNLVGIDAQSCLGKTDDAFFPSAIAQHIREIDREIIRSGTAITLEETIVHPDGTEHIYISNKFVLTDEMGKSYALGGVSTDITDLKQTEIALRQSEQRYQKLADNIPGAIYQLRMAPDASFSWPYISSGCEELFEISASAVMAGSRCPIQMVHPDDLPKFQRIMAKSTQNLTPKLWEGRVVLNSGEIKWIKSASRPELQSDGSIVWDGMMLDITAQQAALRERQRQENALKAIVEWSAMGKTGTDFYQACTQYLTESLGVRYAFVATTIDDSLSKSLRNLLWTGTEFLPPYEMDLAGTPCLQTYEQRWGIFERDLQSLFPQATELATLAAESYLSVVICDFEGNVMGNLGIIDTKPLPQDLAATQFIMQLFADRIAAEMQRHDDEDELRKSQQQIRAFIDNSSAAMYLKDLEGRYRLMNQTCVELSGGDSELFLGETDFAVYPPEIAERIYQIDRELIRSGESITIEDRTISLDGVERTYITNKFVLFDDDGKPYALGGVSTDITDRKHAEEQLNLTNQQLELANQELHRATRLKDEFLATMSHELRTPLNAILGMSEALQDLVFGDLNSSQLNAISTIDRSGTHLLSLINDILDVSKIAAGKLTLNPSKVALSELCQSSLILIEKQASDKQIQILTQLSVEPDWILVDERRMRQVLINLLNNAVKFTPHGGSIKLAVSVEAAAVCDLTEGACLCFSVSDTGIGISQADLAKLFQPFVQVDSSLNRKYQGTGLGLVLVKQIVELHGGYIKIDSEVGVGSCFSIMLPQTCWQFQPQKIAPTSSQNLIPTITHQPKTRTILLVESNEVNVDTFVSYLTAKGDRVIVANTGTAAISILENSSDPSQHPDIILIDLQLPDIDGIAAISYIRQHDLTQIPIIALTALVTPGEREKCLAVGADRYLTKPVKLLELHNTIQECLN